MFLKEIVGKAENFLQNDSFLNRKLLSFIQNSKGLRLIYLLNCCKSNLSLYSQYYAEACDKFAGLISASLRPGNTASFEKMSQRRRAVGNAASDLTGPRFESQTSRSRDERVTAQPTDLITCCKIINRQLNIHSISSHQKFLLPTYAPFKICIGTGHFQIFREKQIRTNYSHTSWRWCCPISCCWF